MDSMQNCGGNSSNGDPWNPPLPSNGPPVRPWSFQNQKQSTTTRPEYMLPNEAYRAYSGTGSANNLSSSESPDLAPWLDVIGAALFGELAEAETTDTTSVPPIEATPASDTFGEDQVATDVSNPESPTRARRQYSDDDPRSHGVLGPNTYPMPVPPVPPEPSWWDQQKWNAEQWTTDRWNNFKENMKSLGEWFFN